MSLSSLGTKPGQVKPRKPSPLLAVAKQRMANPWGAESNSAGNRHFSLLETRVDELSQRLTDLQSEQETTAEHNQVLHGRLSAILDLVPAGIILLDSQGKITQCNRLAEQLLDCSLPEQLWRQVSQQCFKRRMDDGHEISTTTGKRLSVSTRGVGDGAGQIVMLSDQTETRRLQAEVSHQQRLSALGQMVSALAHQIRTPLSAAMLYASHLCDQPLAATQRDRFSHKLRSRLLHMERQVRDMLLFVKGELPLNDQVDRAHFLAELKEALEVPVAESGVSVDWEVGDTDFNLRCNSDALINAILNLVNNAIQAYDETASTEKRLRIAMSVEQDQLHVSVRDYGPGISDTLLAKLAQPFVTTKPQGTGLGLSVVRAVASAHAGQLQLDQQQPGLLARIVLPCQANTGE
ncbi:sensor histidine kinase [Halioxenophilus aromaticivorans]|uniref:histidine kinase n=1 Tax=Halioxenophilus aromaticivorans TaxID=1306992 RepID=A0AAV3TZM4_9ALTE